MFRNIESLDGPAIPALGELPPAVGIKPEEYDVAITISPNPAALPKGPRTQLRGTMRLLCKLLGEFSSWYLTAEYSLAGNIHFHGALRIKDQGKYVDNLARIRSIFGNTLPKYMDNPQKWHDYCIKHTKSYEEQFNLPYAVYGNYKGRRGVGDSVVKRSEEGALRPKADSRHISPNMGDIWKNECSCPGYKNNVRIHLKTCERVSSNI